MSEMGDALERVFLVWLKSNTHRQVYPDTLVKELGKLGREIGVFLPFKHDGNLRSFGQTFRSVKNRLSRKGLNVEIVEQGQHGNKYKFNWLAASERVVKTTPKQPPKGLNGITPGALIVHKVSGEKGMYLEQEDSLCLIATGFNKRVRVEAYEIELA
jgi:hypothetical protein|tara:strand:+ start:563 stop:1033 length:471 start_codon:yes stop_codon:yes gene_type:complete